MCGAYSLHHNKIDIAARFEVQASGGLFGPRYKISPAEPIEIVRVTDRGSRELDQARWGLVPPWATDSGIGRRLINARGETVTEKPAYRAAFDTRRCLIPSDGFYEWDRATRQPMYFRRTDSELFAFAGLWEQWTGPDGAALQSCTVITTQANSTVGRIHDRMPVILMPEFEPLWLGGLASDIGNRSDEPSTADLMQMLQPFPDDLMDGYWVSRSVNGRGAHGPESIAPSQAEAAAGSLTLPM
jgi:putative SOS response-associated peptidase YedK